MLTARTKTIERTGTGRQFVLTAQTKTIERTGTGRQFVLTAQTKTIERTGTGRQFVLTAQTKTIERTGTARQFPPSLASLSATKFSLQIYMELTGTMWAAKHCSILFATIPRFKIAASYRRRFHDASR